MVAGEIASALQEEQVGIDWDGKTVFVRGNRPIYVELTSSNVDAIIHYCKDYMKRGPEKGPPRLKKNAAATPVDNDVGVVCAASSSAAVTNSTGSSRALVPVAAFSMPTNACPPVPHKVTWHPSTTAWAVHYKNSAGENVQKRIRVTSDKEAKDSKSKWDALRYTAYIQALKFWNDEDQSSRERIDFDEPT